MAKTLSFDVTSKRTHEAIALIYDLEGFSKFVNQPDVQNYVPSFLNHVSRAVGTALHGGSAYWLPDAEAEDYSPLLPKPRHEKFLGDGALYIWTFNREEPPTIRFARELCNRLRALAANFQQVERTAYDKVPVAERRAAFGLVWQAASSTNSSEPTSRVRPTNSRAFASTWRVACRATVLRLP